MIMLIRFSRSRRQRSLNFRQRITNSRGRQAMLTSTAHGHRNGPNRPHKRRNQRRSIARRLRQFNTRTHNNFFSFAQSINRRQLRHTRRRQRHSRNRHRNSTRQNMNSFRARINNRLPSRTNQHMRHNRNSANRYHQRHRQRISRHISSLTAKRNMTRRRPNRRHTSSTISSHHMRHNTRTRLRHHRRP